MKVTSSLSLHMIALPVYSSPTWYRLEPCRIMKEYSFVLVSIDRDLHLYKTQIPMSKEHNSLLITSAQSDCLGNDRSRLKERYYDPGLNLD